MLAALSAAALLASCASPEADTVSAPEGTAAVAPPAILTEGTLNICANFGTPPNIYEDEAGNPTGAEADLAEAIATELGLETEWVTLSFAGLIPALQAQQCDVIMSSLYIRAEREEIVDFVPYLVSGTAIAVRVDNPQNITGFDDSLCGTKLLAVNGATGAGYADEKSAECTAAGEPSIDITITDDGANGLQLVLTGQVDAFIDSAELVGFYEKLADGELVRAGDSFGQINIGAATLKGNDDLNAAIQKAIDAHVENGAYEAILADWGFQDRNIANG